MPLTRASSESMLLSRGVQGILSEVFGSAAIPATGAVASPNALLGPMIASALAECGVFAADPTNPTDAECALIRDAIRARFWDCLEYYALVAATNQYTFSVDASSISAGQLSVSGSGGSKRLSDRLAMLAKMLRDRYGIGAYQGSGLGVGVLPPHLPRPFIPPGQNWPPLGSGRGLGYRGY